MKKAEEHTGPVEMLLKTVRHDNHSILKTRTHIFIDMHATVVYSVCLLVHVSLNAYERTNVLS